MKTKTRVCALAMGFLVGGAIQAKEKSILLLGDAGKWTKKTRALFDKISATDLREFALPGDNLYETAEGYDSAWRPWKDAGFTFPLVAIGNHHAGYANEVAYFGMPGEFYASTLEGARFVVLNSDNETNVREQLEFLRNEIAANREEFLFVMYHHPTYTISDRHTWQEKTAFQEGIRDIIKTNRSRITALLLGHDHIATLVDAAGLPLVVSGSAFDPKPTDPVDYTEGDVRVRSQWLFSQKDPHWVNLRWDAATGEAHADFFGVKSGAQCSARIDVHPAVPAAICAESTAPQGKSSDPRRTP